MCIQYGTRARVPTGELQQQKILPLSYQYSNKDACLAYQYRTWFPDQPAARPWVRNKVMELLGWYYAARLLSAKWLWEKMLWAPARVSLLFFFVHWFRVQGRGRGGKNEARKNYGAVAVLVPYLDTLWLVGHSLDTQPAAGLALPYCAGTPATSGFASVWICDDGWYSSYTMDLELFFLVPREERNGKQHWCRGWFWLWLGSCCALNLGWWGGSASDCCLPFSNRAGKDAGRRGARCDWMDVQWMRDPETWRVGVVITLNLIC